MRIYIDTTSLVRSRNKLMWTQEDLATASGISARTIQRIEAQGYGSAETIKAIAAALDIDVGTVKQNLSEGPWSWAVRFAGISVALSACGFGFWEGQSNIAVLVFITLVVFAIAGSSLYGFRKYRTGDFKKEYSAEPITAACQKLQRTLVSLQTLR